MSNNECNHQFDTEYEVSLLGGYYPTGYQCTLCGFHISQSELKPGMRGVLTNRHILRGPHGGKVISNNGEVHDMQIIQPDGTLEYYDKIK